MHVWISNNRIITTGGTDTIIYGMKALRDSMNQFHLFFAPNYIDIMFKNMYPHFFNVPHILIDIWYKANQKDGDPYIRYMGLWKIRTDCDYFWIRAAEYEVVLSNDIWLFYGHCNDPIWLMCYKNFLRVSSIMCTKFHEFQSARKAFLKVKK